jgi:glucose-1-phosphate cytidylyltransferase
MVEIGEKPIIWHIMKIYSQHGIKDFIVCLGYKGYLIKEWFANYFLHTADVTIDLANNDIEVHRKWNEGWRITLVETGAETMTGGRLKAVRHHLPDGEPFCFTYGDGVADIDIGALISFHKQHGGKATVTAVAPPGRFGALEFDSDRIHGFREKPAGDGGLINGGFFVVEPTVIDDYVGGPDTIWEREPMEALASDGELHGYRHDGFWQPMDTLRDKLYLEQLWQQGAPWKCW